MYCGSCGYELSGLGAGPCPECGVAFDPDVPGTYAAESGPARVPRWLTACVVAGSAGPVVWVVLVHVALVGARVELGRWPHRMGADDPSGLKGIGRAGYLVASAGTALLPMSIAVAMTGIVVCGLRRRRAHGAVFAAVLAASWAVAVLIGRADPARALVWFFD